MSLETKVAPSGPLFYNTVGFVNNGEITAESIMFYQEKHFKNSVIYLWLATVATQYITKKMEK